MLRLFISSFFILSLTFEAISQELEYEIFVSDKKVGSMLVTKKEMPEEKTYYSAVSDVEYTLFKSTKLVYFYESVYSNNTLDMAYFVHKKDGAKVEEAKLERLNNSNIYLSNINQKSQTIEKSIKRSMLQLYFIPPNTRDSIFSERFHQYIKIVKLPDENKYMFDIPYSDKSIYEYNDKGICTKITANSSLFKFEFLLNKSDREE